jgi:hypothetical protein
MTSDEYGSGSDASHLGPITIVSLRSDTEALLHEAYAQWEAFSAKRRQVYESQTPEDAVWGAFYWLFRHSGLIQYRPDVAHIPAQPRGARDGA